MTRFFAVEVNAPGIAKRLYGGKNAGRAEEIVRFMRGRCGWTERWPQPGSVGVVQAPTWGAATDKVFAAQIKSGVLQPSP